MGLEPGRYVLFGEAWGGPEAEPLEPTIHEFEVSESADPVPAPEADVRVEMVNFAFVMPTEILSGPLLWEVVNPSDQIHHIGVMRIHEGRTLQDVMSFLETPEGEPPADEVAHINLVSPEYAAYATVDLEPGHYIAVCFIPDHGEEGTGAPHAALGMVQPFTVEGEQ